ncbi:hypothetical protein ISX56_34325, partial [Serratia ureilytica]|nr:hypothetical protein [Serratia ureilytica]
MNHAYGFFSAAANVVFSVSVLHPSTEYRTNFFASRSFALTQWGLQQLGVLITPYSLRYLPNARITDGWQLLFPGLLFI